MPVSFQLCSLRTELASLATSSEYASLQSCDEQAVQEALHEVEMEHLKEIDNVSDPYA